MKRAKGKPKLTITDINTSSMDALEKVLHIIENNADVFQSHEKYVEALRTCIRKAWQFHPMKRLYKDSKVKKIKNPRPNPRRGFEFVKGYTCEICGRDFVEKDVEVDHKVGNNKFTNIESFHLYTTSILHVAPEDLQILCSYPDTDVRSRVRHSCHKVKTYAESAGITFEQALVMKKVISIEKSGDDAVKASLKKMGVVDADLPKTQAARKALLRRLALEGGSVG